MFGDGVLSRMSDTHAGGQVMESHFRCDISGDQKDNFLNNSPRLLRAKSWPSRLGTQNMMLTFLGQKSEQAAEVWRQRLLLMLFWLLCRRQYL